VPLCKPANCSLLHEKDGLRTSAPLSDGVSPPHSRPRQPCCPQWLSRAASVDPELCLRCGGRKGCGRVSGGTASRLTAPFASTPTNPRAPLTPPPGLTDRCGASQDADARLSQTRGNGGFASCGIDILFCVTQGTERWSGGVQTAV